jgi:Transposase IS116/IS110/IS902 family
MRNRSIDTKMFQRIQFRSLVVRCVGAALAAGALVATVPRCAKAEDSAQARRDRCTAAQQDAARPPGHFTRVLLRVLQPSIKPVPATDGLIHLTHVAQVRNVRRQPVDILRSWPSTRWRSRGSLGGLCSALPRRQDCGPTLLRAARGRGTELFACRARPLLDNEASRRLATIPGVGPITASAIVATITDPFQFHSARHLAAWIGLVPRQHSSGGKQRQGGISKQGDRYLRRLLVLGATAVIRHSRSKVAESEAEGTPISGCHS